MREDLSGLRVEKLLDESGDAVGVRGEGAREFAAEISVESWGRGGGDGMVVSV